MLQAVKVSAMPTLLNNNLTVLSSLGLQRTIYIYIFYFRKACNRMLFLSTAIDPKRSQTFWHAALNTNRQKMSKGPFPCAVILVPIWLRGINVLTVIPNQLKRATIQHPVTGKLEHATYRVSKRCVGDCWICGSFIFGVITFWVVVKCALFWMEA